MSVLYSVCVLVFLGFLIAYILVPNNPMNPEAMIPFTFKDRIFMLTAIFSVPMMLTCAAFYRVNKISAKPNKGILFTLIFLPGIVCAGCALFIIGIILAGFINSFILN